MKDLIKRINALFKRLRLTAEQAENIRFPCC